MSDQKKNKDLSADEIFANADDGKVYDGPFQKRYDSGLRISVESDGDFVVHLPVESFRNASGYSDSGSYIKVRAEHTKVFREVMNRALDVLDARQKKLKEE